MSSSYATYLQADEHGKIIRTLCRLARRGPPTDFTGPYLTFPGRPITRLGEFYIKADGTPARRTRLTLSAPNVAPGETGTIRAYAPDKTEVSGVRLCVAGTVIETPDTYTWANETLLTFKIDPTQTEYFADPLTVRIQEDLPDAPTR